MWTGPIFLRHISYLWWLSSRDWVRFFPWNCHQRVTSEASWLWTLHWNWALFPSKAVSNFFLSLLAWASVTKKIILFKKKLTIYFYTKTWIWVFYHEWNEWKKTRKFFLNEWRRKQEILLSSFSTYMAGGIENIIVF